jgi:hypothetical protein
MPALKSGNTMKALFLFLLISSAALANDAALLRCRGIADPTARLVCYDALVLAPAEGKPAQDEVSQPQQFGLPRETNTTTLKAIESNIPGHFEGWRGNARFQLANGQVWQVADGSSVFHEIDNPKVSIRRGVLGAFYMEIEGTNHSPRVRRLQ